MSLSAICSQTKSLSVSLLLLLLLLLLLCAGACLCVLLLPIFHERRACLHIMSGVWQGGSTAA